MIFIINILPENKPLTKLSSGLFHIFIINILPENKPLSKLSSGLSHGELCLYPSQDALWSVLRTRPYRACRLIPIVQLISPAWARSLCLSFHSEATLSCYSPKSWSSLQARGHCLCASEWNHLKLPFHQQAEHCREVLFCMFPKWAPGSWN